MDANAPNQERQHWVPLPYGETTHLVFLAQNEAVNAVAHQQGNNCQAAADQRSSIGSTGLRQNLGGVSRGSGSLDNLLLVRSSGGLVAGRGRVGGRAGGRAGGRVSILALNILEDGGQGNPGIAFVIPVAVQQSLQGVELDMLALDKVSGIATVLVLPANQLLASGNLAIVQVVGQDGELVLSGEVVLRSSNIFLSAVLILDILDGDVLQLDIGLEVSVEVQVSNTVLIDVLASQFLQGLEGDLLTSGILKRRSGTESSRSASHWQSG